MIAVDTIYKQLLNITALRQMVLTCEQVWKVVLRLGDKPAHLFSFTPA